MLNKPITYATIRPLAYVCCYRAFIFKTNIMHADLVGALEQINKSYKAFEHKGQKLSKDQVRKVLKYGISKGYKTTAELSDEEVDNVLYHDCHGKGYEVRGNTIHCRECMNPLFEIIPDMHP